MKKIVFLVFAVFASLVVFAQADTIQYVIEGRVNSVKQQKKPYVILISVDGLRYDYARKFGASNLLRLARQGVEAEYMIPSFPSLTFPNHYTLVTGLYPGHHGLVNNTMYDPISKKIYRMSNRAAVADSSWYGGTPLWVLAEQQQMLSASFYWVGSEAPVKGVRPTYYYNYGEKIAINRRIEIVSEWLKLPEEKRPHLITIYFPEVDHAGHDYGPDAEETAKSVLLIDSAIQQLTEAVAATGLPVNFVLVSDHGMTTVDTTNTLSLPAGLDTSKFIIPTHGNLVHLYAKDNIDVLPAYDLLKRSSNEYKVYLHSNAPKRWRFTGDDDWMKRTGDILIVPGWPKVLLLRKRPINIGWHGYDPAVVPEMNATFMAWGPAFKSGKRIAPFANVHVYPLVARLLGLHIIEPTDGKLKVLKKALK